MSNKLAVALVIVSTACTASIAYPADETQVVTFNLSHATSRDAATVLRSIVGVKKFETADEHTLTLRDTRENLDLATAVVKMLDTTDDTAGTTFLPAGDDSVIAVVVLDRASSVEVMGTLRRELRIARSATVGEKRILLRDTDSQIQAALKVIERVEGNHEDS
jgi:hypothetical protein